MNTKTALVSKLLEIQYQDQLAEESKNPVHYSNRNLFVYEAIPLALRCGYKAGIRIDPSEPEWPVAFIDLPTGQISYHLEQFKDGWDGHTTEQKRLRLFAFIAAVSQGG